MFSSGVCSGFKVWGFAVWTFKSGFEAFGRKRSWDCPFKAWGSARGTMRVPTKGTITGCYLKLRPSRSERDFVDSEPMVTIKGSVKASRMLCP